jgi:hypothetical protein
MEVKGKRPRGRPRSRWEQQARKEVTQKEGRTWEEIEEQKLWQRLGFQTTHLKRKRFRKKKAVLLNLQL